MPKSLINFEKNKEIYKLFHVKAVNEEEEKVILNFLQDLIKTNTLGMCVPVMHLKDILREDKIKNQLELNHGSSFSSEGRIKATRKLFGIPSDIDYKEYPKYGFILDKDPLRHMIQDGDIFYHYGSVILVFKKEALLKRTTMTVGSSLDFAAFNRKNPMLLTKPDISCIEENYQRPFYNAIVSGEITTNMPGEVLPYFMDRNILINNYELQYHGDIIFSRDVEKVYLYPADITEENEFENNCSKILKELNIPYEILSIGI